MPNITRGSRPKRHEWGSKRACDSGTHLTPEERRLIYSLSQYSSWSHRAITSNLQLPRSTVQSAIYVMIGTSRKQRYRKQLLIAPVRNAALTAGISSSDTPSAPHIATKDTIRPPKTFLTLSNERDAEHTIKFDVYASRTTFIVCRGCL